MDEHPLTSGHELWTNTTTNAVAASSRIIWNVDVPPNTSFSVESSLPSTVSMQAYSDLGTLYTQQRDENARLREIVQALAEEDSYTYNDNNGMMECVFCYDTYGFVASEKHTKDHDSDCLITKARILISQIQPKEQ